MRDEKRYWRETKNNARQVFLNLKSQTDEIGAGKGQRMETQEEILAFLGKIARQLAEDNGVRKWLSYMGFLYLSPLEATAVAYGNKLRPKTVQVELKDTRPDVQNCFLRVSKEKDNGLLAEWVRKRIGEAMMID